MPYKIKLKQQNSELFQGQVAWTIIGQKIP